ncbi:MAG TPA: PKD domain-containing protein, partial [Bacteroidia bacterium]
MKRKITLIAIGFFLSLLRLNAQTSCTDLNGFVDSKNIGGTGYYTLQLGFEERAAQTYHYSGPGNLTQVRVNGNYPDVHGGVPLKITIYNVDATGRPTSSCASTNVTWWWFNNISGYMDVSFPGGGVFISKDFAVAVEVRNANPWGTSFKVKYTGDGEGRGDDHISLAGTSTGFNWSSAMNNFGKDGDLYIIPRIKHFISSKFSVNNSCVSTSTLVSFTNETEMTRDTMFNKIGMANYSGTNKFFQWNFGDGSPISNTLNPTHTYTAAGTYTVSLTSTFEGWGNTCSDTYKKIISVGLTVNASAINNVTCNMSCNGSVTALGSGGGTPYLYSMNGINYQPSASFSGLCAGNYNLYIKDNAGCIKNNSFTITQPSPIILNSSASTNSSCGNADGALLINASGGSGALQYKINSGSFQSSGSFTGLHSGSYTVTVKDANNCSNTTYTSVNDLGGPSWVNILHTEVSCYGLNNATITLSATGGSGILQYSVDGLPFQTSGSFYGLPAGKHPVTVKDATGCANYSHILISQPSALSVTASAISTKCNGGNDGEINITSAIGGTGTLAYSINGTNYQSGNNFEGLAPGNFTVYVKDVAGCIATTTTTVTQPTAITASVIATAVSCNGMLDGILNASASGGTNGYVYSIDGTHFQSDGVFSQLAAGTYTVTVKDYNECSKNNAVTITQPNPIVASITTTNSTCSNSNGGMLAVGSGGSGSGYQYSIDGTTFIPSGSFTSLLAGMYYVIIKDGSGCENVFPANIIDSDGPKITSSSHTNVACFDGSDGSITINTVTGGTGVLQYGINGTNWQTSNVFSWLNAGVYVVSVKDAAGCLGTDTITLTQPNAFAVNTTITNATCHGGNDGSVSIYAAGGIGTLAYSIDGNIFQANNVFTG